MVVVSYLFLPLLPPTQACIAFHHGRGVGRRVGRRVSCGGCDGLRVGSGLGFVVFAVVLATVGRREKVRVGAGDEALVGTTDGGAVGEKVGLKSVTFESLILVGAAEGSGDGSVPLPVPFTVGRGVKR